MVGGFSSTFFSQWGDNDGLFAYTSESLLVNGDWGNMSFTVYLLIFSHNDYGDVTTSSDGFWNWKTFVVLCLYFNSLKFGTTLFSLILQVSERIESATWNILRTYKLPE